MRAVVKFQEYRELATLLVLISVMGKLSKIVSFFAMSLEERVLVKAARLTAAGGLKA
jgi:hypothetical protein